MRIVQPVAASDVDINQPSNSLAWPARGLKFRKLCYSKTQQLARLEGRKGNKGKKARVCLRLQNKPEASRRETGNTK
eukprot:1161468-Pelagomonas_calceolata.AAC.1